MMLLNRGALRAARCLHNGKGRPWKAWESRNFSLLLPSKTNSARTPSAGPSVKPVQSRRLLPSSILSRTSIRFASSTSPPPSLTETATSPPSAVLPPSEPLLSDTYIDPLQENIGFLHELGITYGWGPTSTYQYLLEHVYVYSGLGWAPSIIVSALVIRLSLVKVFYNAADTGGRMSALTGAMRPIQARITEAKRLEDRVAVAQAVQELRQLYRGSGVKVYRMFLPLVLQIPLAYGTFRLLNRIAALPVPGLEDEGFLWLQDLTVADPLLLLPLCTSAAFYFSFKFSSQSGAQGTATSQSMRIIMQYVLPVVSGLFMLVWPACMQISFFTTSLFSLLQAYAFRQPGVRQFLGMSRIVKATPPPPPGSPLNLSPAAAAAAAPPPAKTGFMGGAATEIKGAMSQLGADARKRMREQDGLGENSRLSRRELKDAKSYEQRRRREIEMEKEMQKDQPRRAKLKR